MKGSAESARRISHSLSLKNFCTNCTHGVARCDRGKRTREQAGRRKRNKERRWGRRGSEGTAAARAGGG